MMKFFCVKAGEIMQLEKDVNKFIEDQNIRRSYTHEIHFLEREIIVILDY